jgi:hypothetical protein
MTDILSAVVLFCEDIREEADKRFSLNGVFGDNVLIPRVPVLLPKLGIFSRINVPLDKEIKSMKLELRFPENEPILLTTFDTEQIKSQQKISRDQQSPFTGLLVRAIAAPAPVNNYGRVLAVLSFDGIEQVIGHLNFIDRQP